MKRVRYISSFATPMTEEDIDGIVTTSQKNNPARNITGMLVATGDLFYQLLEGPEHEIDALYERILSDPRHNQVLLLASEPGDFQRLCPDWAMQKIDLSMKTTAQTAPGSALLRMIFVQRKLADEALRTLDEYTWEGLNAAEIESS